MVSSPMGTWTQVVVENDLQPGSDGSSVMVTLGTGGGGGGRGGGGGTAARAGAGPGGGSSNTTPVCSSACAAGPGAGVRCSSTAALLPPRIWIMAAFTLASSDTGPGSALSSPGSTLTGPGLAGGGWPGPAEAASLCSKDVSCPKSAEAASVCPEAVSWPKPEASSWGRVC